MVVSAVRDFWTKATSLCFFHFEDQQQTFFRDQSQKTAKTANSNEKISPSTTITTSNFFSLQPNTSTPPPPFTHRNPLSIFPQKIIQNNFFLQKKKTLLVRNPQLFDRVETLARTFNLTRPPATPASFRRPASERGVVKLFDWHACHWLRQCSSPVFAQKKIAWVPHKTGYCKRGHQSPLG